MHSKLKKNDKYNSNESENEKNRQQRKHLERNCDVTFSNRIVNKMNYRQHTADLEIQ